MAQLVLTDKFIVDRGGSTYKTTFEDIQSSLDLAYTYTGEVDLTPGGTVETYTITEKGEFFLTGEEYEFDNENVNVAIVVTEIGSKGEIEASVLAGNSSGIVLPEDDLTAHPFEVVGQAKQISNKSGFDGYTNNTTAEFNIYQAPYDIVNP